MDTDESVYRHADVPGITLHVSVTRCMGDSDVSFRVCDEGRRIYSEADPHIGGMAFNRDGRWLYLQSGFGHERVDTTIDRRDGRRVPDALHASSLGEVVLATEFMDGGTRLGEVGDGKFRGCKFQPIHPMRVVAATMSGEQRLELLREVLTRDPSAEAWADVAGLFERWDAMADRGVALALPMLGRWPEELREKPYWLDWFAPHPLWELVAGGMTILDMKSRPMDVEALSRLLSRPALRQLVHLVLDQCALGDEAASIIAASPSLACLQSLSLCGNPIGDEGAMALARSPYLGKLTSIDLRRTKVSNGALDELRRSPRLPSLELV